MGKGKILIVEDECVVAMSLHDILENSGYQISGLATSGEEALKQVAQSQPDLVLMDIKLKGTMDGVEAATVLRKEFNLPVIYLTAFSDEALIERVKSTEPLGYLVKPYTERDVQITLDLALSKHRLELERRELDAQRRQVQKMEALGTLAGGIAHDLNNLLTALLGNAELAITKTHAESPVKTNLQEILTAGNRGKELVQQILAFSRQVEPRVQPTTLTLLIEETLRLIRATLPASIEIRTHLASGLRPILADSTQIQQVLINLCTNAEHAMRKNGGLLDIGLAHTNVPPEGSSIHPQLQPGKYQRITVRDTGHGIPPQILHKIFDPFYTSKAIGEGTGMGLAVVQGVVASHGGGIAVESSPELGATFSIYLPEVDKDFPLEKAHNGTHFKGSGRILLVEDDQSVAKIGNEMLQGLGYEVVVCTSSKTALDTFRMDPNPYNLVMTDQTMPGLTGEQLASELLKIRPNLPIILCTGFSHTITPEKAHDLGIRGYITKPFLMRDLALACHQAMEP